jgi:lipid-A-disaccharide synthase
MPGSRPGELKALARLFIETARNLAEKRPQTRFLIPLVNRETRQIFEQSLHEARATIDGDHANLPLRILYGHAHEALQAADAALIASGTATLEALLLDCPHVITYKVPWLTWQIMRRQALQPWIGLPNILAAEAVVPEIIQNQATPEALAAGTRTSAERSHRAAKADRGFPPATRTPQTQYSGFDCACLATILERRPPCKLKQASSAALTKPDAGRWPARSMRRR